MVRDCHLISLNSEETTPTDNLEFPNCMSDANPVAQHRHSQLR